MVGDQQIEKRQSVSVPDSSRWICCQIGAREHYAIPRALDASGQLHALLTDTWFKPGHPSASLLGRRAAGRFHEDLERGAVHAWNPAFLALALRQGLRSGGWPAIMARNEQFQRLAVAKLAAIHRKFPNHRFAVFAYSYGARRIVEFAKGAGWITVLGQIDPGPVEESIVARLHREASSQTAAWCPAPRTYWESWRAECEAADYVLVNSEWSRECLVEAGVPGEKIRVVPLVLQPSPEARVFRRSYPKRFTPERPLRVLFLGQAGLRKGIDLVIEAAQRMVSMPVEIRIVGPIQIGVSDAVRQHPVMRWIGSVPRASTNGFYQQADVFLFPTYSDGFGLTQLEAQVWKLPLIVSRFCGKVVEDGIDGVVLDPLSAQTIVDVIRKMIENPDNLGRMAERVTLKPEHRIEGLGSRLCSIITKDVSRNR